MNTNALRREVSGQGGFRFDNVSVHARLLDAAKSTTYAYNTSNQLTSSVTNSVTTTYTYDAWGRLATRGQGSYAASYAYRYGGRSFIRLVPKLHLGMPLGAKLRFAFPPPSPARAPRRSNREAELRGQAHSQVQLGNEGKDCYEHCADDYLEALARCRRNKWCIARAYATLRFCYIRCLIGM
ncbi:MAG: RHS repeat protein [Candidatus Hydrogenedentes bacterium]|nr:RHS repeat protein [Candidatus Hydrogenedentota bacterium]